MKLIDCLIFTVCACFSILVIYLFLKNKIVYQSDSFNQTEKLAFLFLIYDEINQEDLWFDFFKNVDKNKYSIYIHYKVKKPLKYFEQYKIDNCIETKWGDISLARAQLLLYETALQDKQNKKFIILSNSCIPVKNFNYTYNFLMKDEKSYFNEAPLDPLLYDDKLLKSKYKQSEVKKASQWFIINRELTELIVAHKSDTQYFESVHAPDEIFFLTTILKYKTKEEANIVLYKNIPFATTFTNWYNMDYRFPKINNRFTGPYNYETISEEEMNYILSSNSLFARKFNKNCKVNLTLGLNNFSIYNILNKPTQVDIDEYLKDKIKN